MNGRILCVFAILLSCAMCQAESIVMITNSLAACGNVQSMHDLWKDCGFGRDPNGTERSAWIIRTPVGGIEFHRWPFSGARNEDYWYGPVPANVIAQIHTHPVKMDKKPSRKDAAVARAMNIPVYVISVKGIWSVMPDGSIRQEQEPGWYQKLACNEKSESGLGAD